MAKQHDSSGEGQLALVTGELRAAMANITPSGVLAEQHRKMAEPGGAARS